MKIIIAGAGNVGTHLAKLLSREKQDIILMDDDEEKLTALSSNFDLLTVIQITVAAINPVSCGHTTRRLCPNGSGLGIAP